VYNQEKAFGWAPQERGDSEKGNSKPRLGQFGQRSKGGEEDCVGGLLRPQAGVVQTERQEGRRCHHQEFWGHAESGSHGLMGTASF
jgi:hypothetical protein